MVAPDDTTFAYLEGRPFAPAGKDWERALDDWRGLPTDAGAVFDKEVVLDAADIRPSVSWGTNPSQTTTIDDVVPDPTRSPIPPGGGPPGARPGTWGPRRGPPCAAAGAEQG